MTTRGYADAYADDSDNVRSWPAQDAQEPEPDPAPCNCPEHLAYRASLAFNSDRAREFSLDGDPVLLWDRLVDAHTEIVNLKAERDAAWATIARMTLDADRWRCPGPDRECAWCGN